MINMCVLKLKLSDSLRFFLVVEQELTKREVEYVALSRDTTETDLKQRREIHSGTAFYIDQVVFLSVRCLCADDVHVCWTGRLSSMHPVPSLMDANGCSVTF